MGCKNEKKPEIRCDHLTCLNIVIANIIIENGFDCKHLDRKIKWPNRENADHRFVDKQQKSTEMNPREFTEPSMLVASVTIAVFWHEI